MEVVAKKRTLEKDLDVFDDSLVNRRIRNNDLTTFMLKKTGFYSPFTLIKFERTTFRNAKKSRKNDGVN